MTHEPYQGLLTGITEQPLRLYVISPDAEQWLEHIYTNSDSSGQWLLDAYQHVDEVPRAYDPEPNVVVLDLTGDLQAARALLEHAKRAWPQTAFLLFGQEEHAGLQALIAEYGDMPVLYRPGPQELCQRVEEEAAALSYGLLRGLPLSGLLQMMQWERKSGAVLVHCADTWGRLHMRRGELVDAYVHASQQTGEAAALDILAWEKTTLFLERSYHNQHQRIARPLADLLQEAMRAGEEEQPDPAPAASPEHGGHLQQTLEAVLGGIDGALAVALVDHGSGLALGKLGGGLDLDLAAAGNTEVVRAKLRTMESLGIDGDIEDILITLGHQYHIIYLVPGTALFMYLVLSKDRANLAMARYKLKALAAELNGWN